MVTEIKCDKCKAVLDPEVEDGVINCNIGGTNYEICEDCEFVLHKYIRSRITGRENKLIREENERQQANVGISR